MSLKTTRFDEFRCETMGPSKVQMPAELDDLAVKEISQLVFQDDRWQTAQQQLQMRALSREQALKMLQEGAEMYGLLGVEDDEDAGPVDDVDAMVTKPLRVYPTCIRTWQSGDLATLP